MNDILNTEYRIWLTTSRKFFHLNNHWPKIHLNYFKNMANTKSALKNIRKNRSRYLRNRAIISRLKTLEKQFLSAVENKNKEDAEKASSTFISSLEKACKTNIVHKNKIARKKSRCAELISSLWNKSLERLLRCDGNHSRPSLRSQCLVGCD